MKRAVLIVATALLLGAFAAPSVVMASGDEAAGAHEAVGHAPDINWFTFYPSDGRGPPLAIALLNFAVLVFIIVKLFGESLTTYLQNRHDGIKNALEEGKRLRDEAQAKLEEYGEKIANVGKEVDEMVASIRASAEEEKARILANAEAQAAALKQEAQDRIAAEIARARRTLEREVVDAAVAAAEQLLRDKARPDDQSRLADGFIAELVKSDGPPADKPDSGGSVDDSW
jgi:F-type H+-transporting ATPase subunit b